MLLYGKGLTTATVLTTAPISFIFEYNFGSAAVKCNSYSSTIFSLLVSIQIDTFIGTCKHNYS